MLNCRTEFIRYLIKLPTKLTLITTEQFQYTSSWKTKLPILIIEYQK